MSSSMYNLLEAYSAVYNPDVKEDLNLQRDYISEMRLGNLTNSDLVEIAEEVVEIMLSSGISIKESQQIVRSLFTKSNITGRQQKIDRLQEAFQTAFRELTSKASNTAVEEFGKYRNSKKLQESWSARFNQDKRVERVHNRLVAEDIALTKELLILMIEEKDDSYLETNMDKRAKNNKKALADMKTTKAHKDMVGAARRAMGIGEALDPVGEEDDDVDNDGDSDESDEYLKKRRKAIGKSMKKRGKKKDDDEKLDEATAMAKRGYDETKLRKRAGGGEAADRATALENRPTYGDTNKAKQRQTYARKQRGDFRNTASSSPGLHGYAHQSNDPKVKAKQAARGAQRGALTPNEKKQLNMEMEYDVFDMVMEFLQTEGYVDTLEEAEWMMANLIDEEAVDIILGEADSLAAMQARREKRLKAQRKREGTTVAGNDFGHDYSLTPAQQKARRDAEFKAGTKKEEFVNEADSLAAMQARREKRLARQRKQMGTSATGQDFGHNYGMTSAQRKAQQDKEFDAFIGRGKKTKKEEFEAWLDEAMTNYEKNRKRAAQRAAARNAARDQGKTGVVPGVGYVTPRRERETWTDESGKTRHAKGL